MACQCPVPQIHVNSRYNSCASCLKPIDQDVVSDTAKLQGFLNRIPGIPAALIIQCHQRELAGRQEFGLQYLGRDNVDECFQEIADGQNYLFFETLVDRRDGREEDVNLVRAAHHLSQAYEILLERRRRVR